MTSLREALRRLVQRQSDRPDSQLSYTIYWTKTVRSWDSDRRRQALAGAARVLEQPDFISNQYQRRYRVPEIDGSAHSGASLLALREVLEAFERSGD